jgi:hypothetical protein
MSTSPVNLAQAANAQLGVNLPLAYGYNRARGNEIINQQLTGKNRVSFRILGEGEWDGIERLWINSKLVNQADATLVHFHPGIDGVLGAGLAATSTGGDQGVDAFFSLLPANFLPETFSRKAYLALNVPPDPSAPSATLDVIGDFRCCKVRQFDASGNQTAYSFSTNGAWQALDAILRSYLKPEWNPSAAAAAGGDLTAAEKARISFPDVFAAAQACDFLLSLGQKRFSSSVAFVSQISLADALTQMCNISQLFVEEVAGKIYIRADQQRNSTFRLTTDHILAGKMSFDKKDLHAAKNRIICNYRDVNPQDSADIDTPANNGLVRAANVVTVKTKAVHPYLVGDSVHVLPPLDGSVHDTSFDGLQLVASVPSTTTWTYAQVAANATSGNGYTGTPESRFAQRSLQVDHENHQKSIGQRGLNLSSAFRVSPVTIDLGNTTEEQVKRTATFMKNRMLGLDQTPYLAPFAGTLSCYMDAVDVNGNSLIKQICGDIITVDATVSEEFQGDYEIKQMGYNIPGVGGDNGQSNAPTIDLTLLQYLSAAISDGIFLAQPISASVPRNGLPPSSILDLAGTTSDGIAIAPGARNLVRNPDMGIWTPATGIQSLFASSARIDDLDVAGVQQKTPNCWTRNFDNVGNGEGVIYRSTFFAPSGSYSLILQDRQGSTGDCFSAASDAIPLIPGQQYKFVASFNIGAGGFPAHAAWYFRATFFKPGTTDFSVGSATKSAINPVGVGGVGAAAPGIYDIVEASTASGILTKSAVITCPSDAGFARIIFYHYYDGVTLPVTVWNMLVGNIQCLPLVALPDETNGQLAGTFRNNPVNSNGQFTGANPLSQSGGANTILIAASSIRFGDGVVSYSSGSVNPGSLGKWYVYADDPAFTGGTVTYQATSDVSILNGGNGRVGFGVITTTSGGSAVGTGGGGGGAGGVKLPQ